jgi:cell division protein FtsW
VRAALFRHPLTLRIVSLVLLLLAWGLLLLFSASAVLGAKRWDSELYFVSRQAAAAALGLLVAYGLSRVDYRLWNGLGWPILTGQAILLLATYVDGLGWHAQGAQRWLRLGPLAFQPSELARITIPLFVAQLLARYPARGAPPGSTGRRWGAGLAMVGVVLLLVLRQPDLGTTVLLATTTLALFFVAGARVTYVGIVGVVAVAGALLAMWHSDYRRRRLLAFLNPWSDPQGSGFQTIQSFLAFHSGGLTGTGLGNGNGKLFFLPEIHTDFIFSLVGEETGFLGAAVLLVLYLMLAFWMFRVAFAVRDPFASYLALGLALTLTLPVVINVGGVVGLLPVKGMALPFVSWGRSAMVVNLAAIGILLSVVSAAEAPTSVEKKK